jgi:predicted nucleic acid-binding protein
LNLYADTSFLFSLYVADVNSLRALAHRAALTEPLPFSSLNRLELRNAIELAVFRGRLSAAKSILVWRNVEADLQSGALAAAPVDWPSAYRRAESMTAAFTSTLGCRSLDVLQVAAALMLGANELLAFDHRQAALAQSAGLVVRP